MTKPDLHHTWLEMASSQFYAWANQPFDFAIFDCETTGLQTHLAEIVSIGVVTFDFVESEIQLTKHWESLIKPKQIHKLSVPDRRTGKSPTDIHGITPTDVQDAKLFSEMWLDIYHVLNGKHWLCWNAGYDVELLDSLCIRHRLPLIGRASVTCAMKLCSPLGEEFDTKHNSYRWQKLTKMAKLMNLPFDDAHGALADAKMTYHVLRYAYDCVRREKRLDDRLL